MLYLGSHVSCSGKKMMMGSVEEALNYGANALMLYTGAPQNTRRKALEDMMIDEAHALLAENGIKLENVVVHAPYIINLGNAVKPETFEIAVSFLREEIKRTEAIGAKYIVLHPGAHVGEGEEIGLNQIVKGLNEVLTAEQNVIVALETMAGKGTEMGKTFEQLKYIIENVNLPEKLGVCLDTCHIHDAGFDVTNFDEVLDMFDKTIGLERLNVLHINDSKNIRGAAKDRHANIGYGEIGFEALLNVVNNKRVENVVKILETPYVADNPPYKTEIEMLKSGVFTDWIEV
ncbi:MAG: deoxyribonuclease IV [Mycoplasmatales bacterium]